MPLTLSRRIESKSKTQVVADNTDTYILPFYVAGDQYGLVEYDIYGQWTDTGVKFGGGKGLIVAFKRPPAGAITIAGSGNPFGELGDFPFSATFAVVVDPTNAERFVLKLKTTIGFDIKTLVVRTVKWMKVSL